jgi:hypothetical protein
MATDPSIILQGAQPPPQPFTLNSIAQLMQMQQAAQQMKQQRAVQNSLAAIYSNPANLGPDGMPNAQAIQQIGRISPQAAQQLTTQRATVDEKQALTSQHQMEAGQLAQKNIQSLVRDPALNAYDQALASGKTPQQAQQIAQGVYSDGVQQLFAGGYVPDALKQQVPQAFDPLRVRANSLTYKDRMALEEKEKSDTRADQRLAITDERMAMTQRQQDRQFALADRRESRIESQLAAANAPPSKDGTVNGFSPEDIDILARKDMAGLPLNLSRGKSMDSVRRAITERQLQIAKEEGGGAKEAVEDMQQGKADTAGITKAVRDFSTGKQGDTVRSINVSLNHLDTLKEAADALKNGDIKVFNTISQKIADQTGHAAPGNFDSLKQIVGDELIKGIIGAGGGEGDREKIAEALDKAKSPEQLIGIFNGYQNLLGGQLNGLRRQYKASTKRDDFNDRLLGPRARALIGDDQDGNAKGGNKTLTYDPATGTFQ